MLTVDCASQFVLWVGGYIENHRKSIKNSSVDAKVGGQGVTDVTLPDLDSVCSGCVYVQKIHQKQQRGC